MSGMNRHGLMISLMVFAVIPLAFTLPKWAGILQAALAGCSIGVHTTRLKAGANRSG